MRFVMSIMIVLVIIAVIVRIDGMCRCRIRIPLPVWFAQKMERDVIDVKREKQCKKPPRHQYQGGAQLFARCSDFTKRYQAAILPD